MLASLGSLLTSERLPPGAAETSTKRTLAETYQKIHQAHVHRAGSQRPPLSNMTERFILPVLSYKDELELRNT